MVSIKFPNMFDNTTVQTVSDRDATSQNLKYLLLSGKNEMFGDPFYGTNLKKFFFEQNDVILEDLLIDDIYTAISTFMPQIKINRKDIRLSKDIAKVYVEIKCINRLNFKTDLYNIVLFDVNN